MQCKHFYSLALLLLTVFLVGCFSFTSGLDTSSGPQEITTLATATPATVEVQGPFDIILVPGSQIRANMTPQIAQAIVVDRSGSLLKIAPRRGLLVSGKAPAQILVGVDSIRNLTIRTTQTISTQGRISVTALGLVLAGTVTGLLDLDISQLSLIVETGKLIRLTGIVGTLSLEAKSSMAHVDLKRLRLLNEPLINSPVHGPRIKF